MALITIFVRKEITTDRIDILHGFGKRMNTVAYRDRECTQRMAQWPWYHSGCPDRRYRTVMLNCYRWKLEWVNEVKGVTQ